MKRIWKHPEEPQNAKRYWRSVSELERRENFLKDLGREFPAGDTLTEEERENGRRDFLKIMGASVGLMGLASCRRPLTTILPYTQHVEWMVPGKALMYATTMPRSGGATPLVVTTHEGRPTHVTGNPLHPLGGGVDAFAQASVLDLYDPERSQKPLGAGKELSWAKANDLLAAAAAEAKKGAGIGIVTGATSSPTYLRLLAEVKAAFPQSKLFQYEAAGGEGQPAANKEILGAGVKSFVKLGSAMRILSLDCDFLGLDPVAGEPISAFTKHRAKDAKAADMNRLYVLENRYTLTGGMADHRKALPASLIPAAAALIAAELGDASAKTLADTAPASLKEWIAPAVRDLIDNKGKSVVLAGSRHGAEVHALVASINNALGAYGSTIELLQDNTAAEFGTFAELQAAVSAGQIKTLVSLTPANLYYDAPDAESFSKLVTEKKVKLIHVGMLVNTTARHAALHIPAAHYLESWGDARAADGTYSIVQPMIAPLYDGASKIEVLLALLGRKKFGPAEAAAPAAAGAAPAAPAAPAEDAAYIAVRDTFAAVVGGLDETKWNFTLRDGFLKGSAFAKAGATPNVAAVAGIVAKAKPAAAPSDDALEIVLAPDSSVFDGRYTNNAWLQEAPDPVTKLTWDNAAWIGSVTFRRLGLKEGQHVKISVGGAEIEIPAIEAPGHATNSITLPLGYGQKGVGVVGSDRGVNAYTLRKQPGAFVLSGAKVEALATVAELAITQDQNTMEGRAIYREGTLDTFNQDPHFAGKTGMDSHIPENISFYKGQVGVKSDENPAGFDYETKHQWGMVIDLSKCIGCTACIVACQSENNIPVVGKDQVRKGRIMQWIRMDRYFAVPKWGKNNVEQESTWAEDNPTPEQLENAEMVSQPMACQQCEAAPCETVCPVNATVHTDDGLNAMAYNRCIGTRYCANNCPYTARRFNWFDYNKRNPLTETKVLGIKMNNLYAGPLGEKKEDESLRLQRNPNVTVRMRGVIEKCTYCVQRLESAKILQKQVQRDSKNFRVPTDTVKTACQQSCPADAIVFGDLADKNSAVVKAKASPRDYQVLKYIGTRPRTSYLARLRNPNPKMPGAENIAVWSKNQF
ncbi:TAT-variant-translocated molybdopterin oxidoreductase [Prosthecobacter sp.]|jgi:molybdopterin-containing oxidoreductase family iron-sulfur binding subunit|uniref:TAT-variant-translocated molybdopterin oxidoreductase n=1 Tax=Prosthecobacter sp. TaxID=1965333 RepID=UPI003784F060